MYASPQHNPYQAQAAQTAGPAQLVLMLYDRALVGLMRARQATGADGNEIVNHELGRAQEILIELRVTLDHEQGGEIARNLDLLYDFCVDRLIQANITKNLDVLDEVQPVIQELRDTWDEACCRSTLSMTG